MSINAYLMQQNPCIHNQFIIRLQNLSLSGHKFNVTRAHKLKSISISHAKKSIPLEIQCHESLPQLWDQEQSQETDGKVKSLPSHRCPLSGQMTVNKVNPAHICLPLILPSSVVVPVQSNDWLGRPVTFIIHCPFSPRNDWESRWRLGIVVGGGKNTGSCLEVCMKQCIVIAMKVASWT